MAAPIDAAPLMNEGRGAAEGPQPFLWGTGIIISEFKAKFADFLETFGRTDTEPAYFLLQLQSMRLNDATKLEMDFELLRRNHPILYQQIVDHPAECFEMMGEVVSDLVKVLYPDTPVDSIFSVAGKNLPNCVSLRNLSPQHIETLVAVKGMVVRASKIIPEVRVAHFECWVCHNVEKSVVMRGRISEPVRCAHCGRQYSYQLIHNASLFEDKQIIRVQEAPENLGDGETPVTVSVVVYKDLVDIVVPGDRVVITGIYRSTPVKLNAQTRIIRSVFRTHLDAIHIEKSAQTTASGSIALAEGDVIDANTIEELKKVAQRPDIYELLQRSLAPSVWGHDDVKRGILCQMFGGSKKVFRHGGFRSELNVILCGDPGVAKSQLLTQVHRISPRGIYTSGKGSSSVGLTAFVVKDADTGEFVLEPGALVLSDRGICCIDEFDKMNESTRSVLHEVMEQQTLSVAKAGIIAQLNARTSILAAANPVDSQWNPALNIVENLQIEPTLLSRFDLIFLLLDKQDEQEDRNLAAHVMAMYMEEGTSPTQQHPPPPPLQFATTRSPITQGPSSAEFLPPSLFTKYVAWARESINPALSEEAHTALVAAYLEMRRVRGSGKMVTATLRQLESMIRLAEARAKMRFARFVTADDVVESKRLISVALKEAATDPRTGLINLDMFAAPDPGRNTVESCMLKLDRLIQQKYLPSGKKTVSVNELRQGLNELSAGHRPLAPAQFLEVLSMMAGGEVVQSFTHSTVTLASKGP